MATDWNKHRVFSGITEDHSNYTWYKGETENPYQGDQKRHLAAQFWEYEREFHLAFLSHPEASLTLAEAYLQWKASFLHEHLPDKAPREWERIFETGIE